MQSHHHTSGKKNSHPDKVGKKRRYKRLLFKNGESNITHCSVRHKRMRYMADLFTTLIDAKWTYAVLLFVAAFVVSWLIGSLAWLLVAFSRQDTDPAKLDEARCVTGVKSFVTAFEFSMETQHTIGYGTPRSPNTACPEVVLFMKLQSVAGVLIQAFMTGFIFAKLTLPGKRAGAVMFSREAVIAKRDDQMVLLIRVGDMRRSQLMEASIRGVLVRKRITRENEILPLEQFPVDFGCDTGRNRLFLPFPAIVEHRIDESSPFWDVSAADLQYEQFELVVTLGGCAESTSSTTEARTSYLPSEILWGRNFERLVTYQKENGRYQIDFNRFHATRAIPLFPRLSARQLARMDSTNLRLFDLPEPDAAAAAGAAAAAADVAVVADIDETADRPDDDRRARAVRSGAGNVCRRASAAAATSLPLQDTAF